MIHYAFFYGFKLCDMVLKPQHIAASKGHENIVLFLIQAGALVNQSGQVAFAFAFALSFFFCSRITITITITDKLLSPQIILEIRPY